MDLITTSPYYPSAITSIEQQTIFNLECLRKGIYSQVDNLTYPHLFTETPATYAAPIIQSRTVPTPENGMRMIYTIAFLIRPGAGFDATGIWNHALPLSGNLVLP